MSFMLIQDLSIVMLIVKILTNHQNICCHFQKSELSSKDTDMEDTTNVAHVTSIKLFGRTIQMIDSQKSLDENGRISLQLQASR